MTSKRSLRRRLNDLAEEEGRETETITIRHIAVDEDGNREGVVRETTYGVNHD